MQGSFNIPQGTQDVVVTAPFGSVPDSIVCLVSNTSSDTVKYSLGAILVAKSSSGFTVHLSGATNTPNYVLEWIAAFNAGVTVAQPSRPWSSIPTRSALPGTDEWLMSFRNSPIPQVERFSMALLRSSFANFVATPPTAPTDTGAPGQWSFDANYLYVYAGSLWGRVKLATADWSSDPTLTGMVASAGQHAISNGQQTISVVFSSPLPTAPNVTFSIQNTASTNKAMLTGVITAVSTTGFTVLLNSPSPDANSIIVWQAIFTAA